RKEGLAHIGVGLTSFARDAVILDGGEVETETDSTLTLILPHSWTQARSLDDLPGYEPAFRRIRLTTDIEQTRDANGRALGYLGRAHPLVHRALERVRRFSTGGESGMQDPRVSAVSAPVGKPELLMTYVGRISSSAGRALEQVIAVRVS